MTADSATNLTELHQLLSEYFSLAEIRTLCFQLNVDYESVPGEEKPSRIRELLLGLGRNGRLLELVTLAQRQRPNVTWPPMPNGFQILVALAIDSTVMPTSQYHVYGSMVQNDKVGDDKVDKDKITVGSIKGSQGVAIGREVKAYVNTQQEVIANELTQIFGDLVGSSSVP